ALQIAKAMGAEVVAITRSADKADLARKLGADHVISGSGHVGQQLLEMGGADAVLSTTEDSAAMEQALEGIRPKGTLVISAFATTPMTIVPLALTMGQKKIVSHVFGSRKDLEELLKLAVKHKISATIERFPLEEVNHAHDRLRQNQIRLRGVIVPE